MPAVMEALQFSLLNVDFYCPISCSWETKGKHLLACKIELSKGDSLQRQTLWWDTKGTLKCVKFFIRLWISSDHVPLLKLNALVTVHLIHFLSTDTNPPSLTTPELLYCPSHRSLSSYCIKFSNNRQINPSASVCVWNSYFYLSPLFSCPSVCLCLSIWLFLQFPGGGGGGGQR